jgi:GR25 family glycosyltransferase involved in LPS biosynthesis
MGEPLIKKNPMKLSTLLKLKFKRNRTSLKHNVIGTLGYYNNASFRGVAKKLLPLIKRLHEAVG